MVEEHFICFAVVVPASDSSTLDFICGHGQVATPPFCFHRVADQILEESRSFELPWFHIEKNYLKTHIRSLPIAITSFAATNTAYDNSMDGSNCRFTFDPQVGSAESLFFCAGSSSSGVRSWKISHFRTWSRVDSCRSAMNGGSGSKSLGGCVTIESDIDTTTDSNAAIVFQPLTQLVATGLDSSRANMIRRGTCCRRDIPEKHSHNNQSEVVHIVWRWDN
jgi:hypothetical protein